MLKDENDEKDKPAGKNPYLLEYSLSSLKPAFFGVYPLKSNLKAAGSQTGPWREEDDSLRHTNLQQP